MSLYAAAVAVGVALAAVDGSSSALSFGLGLVFPGGGFLVYAAGSPWMIAMHVGLFLLSQCEIIECTDTGVLFHFRNRRCSGNSSAAQSFKLQAGEAMTVTDLEFKTRPQQNVVRRGDFRLQQALR